MGCPNKTSLEWIKLVSSFGQVGAMKIFDTFQEVPEMDTIDMLINIHNNALKEQEAKQKIDIEKASQELESLESEKLSKLTDEFFSFVQRELRDLTHKGYEEIKKVFENKITKSDFTLLYDQLKQAALKTDDGEGFKKKAEGFALAVDQLELITSKLLDSVKTRDFSTLTNLEKMQELQKYTGFLNEWSNFITELRKDLQGAQEILPTIHKIQGNINTATDLINTINNKAVIAEMGVILEDTLETQTDRFNKGLDRLSKILDTAKANSDIGKVKQTQQLIDKLKAEYKDKAMTPENIAEFLSGNRGDTNALSAFFEAYMSSPDPITYAAKKKTKEAVEKARQETYNTDFKLQQLVAPILKKLGYNPLKPFEFWKQFTQGTKSIDKDGNEYKKLELLNEFNEEWKKDLQVKQKAVKDAEETKDETAIYSAKQDLRKFLRNYMFQQYTDDYYDRFEVWDDEIGKKAFNQRQEIFDKMSDLQLQLDKLEAVGIDYTPEQYQEQEDLIFQLRRLSALTDENGQPKTGEALEIAKKHIEYQEKTRDIVEYKERIGAVERARLIFSKGLEAQGIKSDSEEYKRLLDLWDSQNFRQMNTPEFYIDRQKLLNELNDISSQVKQDSQEKTKEFTETWQAIFDQLKGYRDADGQPIGTALTEGKTKEIKNLQEELEKIKGSIESLSGLTPNESNELQQIWQNIKINKSVTPEEKIRKEYLETKRDSLGLSKREKQRFYELIQELSAMQTKIPTDYYINQLNSIVSPQGESFTLLSAEELLSDTRKLKELRKNPAFNTWFEANHMRVEKFNPDTQNKEQTWQRLYQWNRVVPLDEKYIEKTVLEDGTVINGKPALKYYYRDVKDKYKTPRIVGTTVDNKGNYLPKSYSNSGSLMAKDDTYINKEFFRLKNSQNSEDQAKFELLNIMREYLLKAQEDLSYSDRLWLEIPRLEKQFQEIIRTDGFKGVKQHLIDKILFFKNKVAEDNEETNVKQQAKTDLFGTELTIIPVKYKGTLNSEDVSLDLLRSINKYTESTNTKKALMEIHPFIKALESMLEQYGHKDISKIRIAVNKFLNFARKQLNIPIPAQQEDAPISQSNYTRLENIRRLEKRDYQGIYKEGLFLNGRTAFTDALDYYLISPLMSFSGLSILGFDYIGSTVNSLAGNGYKYLDAISNRSFTVKDAIEAENTYVTKVIPSLLADGEQELGVKSFYGQLIDLFDPQQKTSDKLGNKYTSNRLLTSLSFLKHALTNPRDYGEHQIAITTMLAMLKNVRVEYQGESISIIDAFELDSNGKLQLKSGVNFSESKLFTEKEKIRQAIREAQGNYAEEDKAEIERYVLGRLLFFFRKYFIPLAMDAWGTNRFNGSSGEREGYYITMAKTIKLMTQGLKDKVNNWDLVSYEEKRATLKGMLFLASTFVFMALIKALDPDDDKEKWKKTRKWSYAKIQALFLALRVKSEIEQNTPLGGINNTTQIINNPFLIARKLVQLENLGDAIFYNIAGSDKANYSSKGGYDKLMMTLYGTKNKALVALYKILGYRGGGIKASIPGTQESKEVSAYRLKTTSVFARKN